MGNKSVSVDKQLQAEINRMRLQALIRQNQIWIDYYQRKIREYERLQHDNSPIIMIILSIFFLCIMLINAYAG